MKIIKIDINDRYRVQQFIDLPYKIYKNIPQWVPPLETDVKHYFDVQHNPFYKHSEAAFFLAITADGSATGRVVLINNHHYNEYNQQKTAFFYLFECFNDPLACELLFSAAFAWAGARGLTNITGPRGFSALDGLGMLVNGFEHRPAFGIAYNPPYYPDLIESVGFSPKDDIVSGYLSAENPFPENIHRISRLVQDRRGLSIARFRKRKDLRKFVLHLKSLYNSMIEGTSDNYPISDEEAKAMGNQLLWFANPRLIKVILKGETPVGFLFAYPDISAALQRTGGRIFPWGWIEVLKEIHRTEWVNINGAGIKEEFRGLGGTAILFSEMQKSVLEGKFKHAEIVQVGVENERMQREMRELGIDFYKLHRVYKRDL